MIREKLFEKITNNKQLDKTCSQEKSITSAGASRHLKHNKIN